MTYMDRVLNAVHDDAWQAFRVSMKGELTWVKLQMLQDYWDSHVGPEYERVPGDNCVYCIRVDNYLKALCRGGQLHPGQSLQTALDHDWQLTIRR